MKNFSNSNFTNNQKINEKTIISREIENIYQFLVANVSNTSVVVKEKLSKWASCQSLISIYRISDLKKYSTFKDGKALKVKPIVSFGFYPSVYDPERLGSIAIYGDNAKQYVDILNQTRQIFGYPILSVKAEVGLRWFADVRIKY